MNWISECNTNIHLIKGRGCLKMINLIMKRGILFSNNFIKKPIIIIKLWLIIINIYIFLYNKKEINKPPNFNIQL